MAVTIGVRREDKNAWERRVPLVPTDLADLQRSLPVDFLVQPSPIRVFTDDDYRAAGVVVSGDLEPADIVVAVKEIPLDLLREGKVYLFFSHTIKGQPGNMPLLQRMLDLEATLIDYERIADERDRRLIFFSRHAGYAGMVETLVALGRRLAAQGCRTPFDELQPAHVHPDQDSSRAQLCRVGETIAAGGLGDRRRPLVIGIAGYGNVAGGCREVLDCLPVRDIEVADLATLSESDVDAAGPLLCVTFREEDMVRPKSAEVQFVLQDYYQRPENYRGVFERYLPHLDVLVNTIFWDTPYPRLITRKWARDAWSGGKEPRLQVIGDISCDIGGGIELTLAATMPDEPCFVFDTTTDKAVAGVSGNGPAIMAVDNLPCEIARESSEHFSNVLRAMVPDLVRADFSGDFAALALPPHLKKAVVTYRGELTPGYRYLREFLSGAHGR